MLDVLDEDDKGEDIFIQPPAVNDITDEELGNNVNALSRNQLLAPAEIRQSRQDSEENACSNSNPGKKAKKIK